jgi:peptidyl-prolyl cis-trans isomerase D
MPLEQAIREAGIALPPPRPAQARQIDLARVAQGQQVPRPLALLFAMRQGDTKLIPAEQGAGWFVVSLQRVVPGDARSIPTLIESTRNEFTRVLGDEYAQQFSNAVTRELGVKRDEAAIARLRTQLGNSGGGQ